MATAHQHVLLITVRDNAGKNLGHLARRLLSLVGTDLRVTLDERREVDDLTPRSHLPRAFFAAPVMGEVYAIIEVQLKDPAMASEIARDVVTTRLSEGAEGVGAYLARTNLVRDYARERPPGARTPGVKMVVMGRRHPDLTLAQFERHWRDVHAPIALKHHPRLWRYSQNVVLTRYGDAVPQLDSVAELHFRTVDDLTLRLYDSLDGRRVIAADAKRFGGGGDTFFFKETILQLGA